MNIKKIYLLSLIISLPITAHQAHDSQADIVKKLKKAWKSNWVKAGSITTVCASLYALRYAYLNNNKLFWGLTSAASTLTCGACIYAYFTEHTKYSSKAAQNNNKANARLDDDFFDFDFTDEEEISTQKDVVEENSPESTPLTEITETAAMGDTELPEAIESEILQ